MNPPASDQDALALVRDLVIDVKDLTLKEIEAAKLYARLELEQLQRRVLYGLGAAGLTLLVTALVAVAAALALARSFNLSLEAALLIVACVPTLGALVLLAMLRKRRI